MRSCSICILVSVSFHLAWSPPSPSCCGQWQAGGIEWPADIVVGRFHYWQIVLSLSLSILYSFEGNLCRPSLKNRGVLPYLLENGAATKIIWNYSTWEICLFSPFISLFNHLLMSACARGHLFYSLGYNLISLYLVFSDCCSFGD